MAKNIALTLTINGVKQNIQNINQLEEAIKGAQDQLKGMDIGSESFKKLSTDVRNAKNVLEDFEESVKGQDIEKRVGAFAKVGEGITASFAGAQAAISLFGTESEAVAEAAAKAQSVLTIALAARSAAEGLVSIRTVAANIATYASAAAANAATVATRTLWATLAANPYGAILAAIGAVVAALIAFTGKAKEQVNVTKELMMVQSDEANKLKNSLTILTQFTGQRELQRVEIEKLKKEYPGFNAFINRENQLNEAGIKFLKLKIRQYELEAQAKLLTQKIAEASIKIMEIEGSAILDNVEWYESLWNVIKTGGMPSQAILEDFRTGLENQRQKVTEQTQAIELYRKGLNDVYVQTDEVYKQLKPYNQTLEQQVKIEKDLATTKDNAAKLQQEVSAAYKKGLTSTIDLTKAVEELNKTFKNYEQTIRNLEEIKYDAPILEQLENIKEARKQAAQELVSGVELVKKSIENLGTTLPTDVLFENFVVLRKNLEDNFNAIGTKAFKPFTQVYAEFVANLKARGVDVTKDQERVFQSIVQGYKALSDTISDTQAFKDFVTGLTGVKVAFDDFRGGVDKAFDGAQAFQMMMGDILAANNVFVRDLKESGSLLDAIFQIDGTPTIEPVSFDIVKLQQNAAEYTRQLEQALFKPIAERLVQQEIEIQQKLLKAAQETGKTVEAAEIKGRIETLSKQIVEIRKNGQLVKEFSQTTTQQVQGQVGKIVTEFIKLATALTKSEQEILAVNLQVNKLTTDLKDNTKGLSEAIGGVVLQNIETISTLLIGARTKEQKIEQDFINKVKADRVGLEKFKQDLIKMGVNVEKASYEDLLQAYILFKRKEVDATKSAESEKQKATQATLKNIEQVFQQFSTSLNMISAVTQERVRADLELLKVAEKQTLEQVVGDSETAAQKRLEIQQEYEQKRKEIEKQGRISALKSSLVQSIANAAQAITALWTNPFIAANPILGAIQTAVIAGVTAAQIGVIQDQISAAQALRRGGILRAQSGMLLQGPSHEQGGIPLAQMGVVAEGNEAIINRQSSINFRDLLSTINQSGGGRPLVVNNFDDSRIVEALAKQKQTPIRAYVLGSDITNEQMISKRLDDLSKF